MLKRITIITLLMLFTIATYANIDKSGNSDDALQIFKPSKITATPQEWGSYIDTKNYYKKDFNNFYIGFHGGGSVNSFKNVGHTNNAFNGFGGINFGYGGKLENLYLGAAVDAAYNFAKYKNNGTTIKMPYAAGLYVVPGAFITKNTLLYLKAGGAFSKLKQTGTESLSKNVLGFRVGIGVRAYLNKSFSIDTEYMFSCYEKAKPKYSDKYTPYTNQFSIGFAFHF